MDYAYRHGVATAVERLGLTKTALTMPAIPAGAEKYLSKILPALKDTARGAGYGAVSGGLGGLISSQDDDAESALSRAGRGMLAGSIMGAASNALTHSILHGSGALKSKFGLGAARAEHEGAKEALRHQSVLDQEIFGHAVQNHKEHLAKPQLEEIERTLGPVVDEAQSRRSKLNDMYYAIADNHATNPTEDTRRALEEHRALLSEATKQESDTLRQYRRARRDVLPVVNMTEYPEDVMRLYEAAKSSTRAADAHPAFNPGMRGVLDYLPDASMLPYMPIRMTPASVGFMSGRRLEAPKKRGEER